MKAGDQVVTIVWHTNPFRGDKFEDAWRPAAEAALDFGASFWALLRSQDDPLDFIQLAIFASKQDFDRYWYSEQIAEARAEAAGLFQVPVYPAWNRAAGAGAIEAVEGTPAVS
ncbi:MAG: hypothetical protein NVSMB25_17580 [Thermoleophilaceae bacterium]